MVREVQQAVDRVYAAFANVRPGGKLDLYEKPEVEGPDGDPVVTRVLIIMLAEGARQPSALRAAAGYRASGRIFSTRLHYPEKG